MNRRRNWITFPISYQFWRPQQSERDPGEIEFRIRVIRASIHYQSCASTQLLVTVAAAACSGQADNISITAIDSTTRTYDTTQTTLDFLFVTNECIYKIYMIFGTCYKLHKSTNECILT